MSNISATDGSFNLGEVLATSIRTLNRGWLKLIGLTVLPWVLAYALVLGGIFGGVAISFGVRSIPSVSAAMIFMIFALSVAIGICYVACQAALIYGVVEQLRGRSYSFGQAVAVGLWRIGRMIGIGLLVFVAFVVLAILFRSVSAILPPLLSSLAAIALIFIGVPMVTCAFFVLFPVASVEEHGVFGSFTRSRFLTKGYRWPLFGLMLILFLGSLALNLLLGYVVGAVLPPVVGTFVVIAAQVWLSALSSVVIAVAYFRLRYLKEGVDLDQIAGVFD